MPITKEEALALVDPSLSDESPGNGVPSPREQSAQRIMDGVAANEVYWSHRPDLEALRAQVEGHSAQALAEAVQANRSDGEPSGLGSTTETPPAIDSTATEEPTTALETGASATPGVDVTPPAAPGPVPSPDNPNDAIATLRQQLRDAGIDPEA